MSRNTFWGNIFKKREEDSLRHLLKRSPLFHDLKSRELALLEKLVYPRYYRAGEVIFERGDRGAGMYIISYGSVKIFVKTEEQEVELAVLGKDDFFGEVALVGELSRTASAKALEDTELIGFFRPELLELIARNPAAGVKVLLRLAEVLGTRLNRANEEIMNMKFPLKSIEEV
ncbi:MAG: cyclic nucleotide-binding domain-containing protein [Nitrospinota bacterium]|nr:MAG: cyclic nucleotide-binding domain-containing protein [Nitrospinota bacterium]